MHNIKHLDNNHGDYFISENFSIIIYLVLYTFKHKWDWIIHTFYTTLLTDFGFTVDCSSKLIQNINLKSNLKKVVKIN